jgi:DNA-binding transcriptional MerR regulator
MDRSFYRTGQFAKKASVSERTLRFYDQKGLLSPAQYSEAGYRLYTDEDYPRLQQILALKYLGFSLQEIHRTLEGAPADVRRALSVQKAMMKERIAHLEAIIATIEQTEDRLDEETQDWEPIIKIIEVIQMNEKKEWVKKYFSEDEIQKLNEISAGSYSPEAAGKIAEWGKDWSEEDQRQADQEWAALYAAVRELADAGADPLGPQAQALAERWMAQVNAFTHDDPQVMEGLQKLWGKLNSLPADQSPIPKALSPAHEAFWNQAMEHYRQNR